MALLQWIRTPSMPRAVPQTPLARLSVSLPGALLSQLDAMVDRRALSNRSQLIAELIRRELADHREALGTAALAGTITLIYRADGGRVREALARAQSGYMKEIISSQHIFLEGDQSLEVLLVQGPAQRLLQLCDGLRRVRDVLQTKLVTTTALLPPLHSRGRPAAPPVRKIRYRAPKERA
jgi:CopG family nickel-responsive transcriptional regulator